MKKKDARKFIQEWNEYMEESTNVDDRVLEYDEEDVEYVVDILYGVDKPFDRFKTER